MVFFLGFLTSCIGSIQIQMLINWLIIYSFLFYFCSYYFMKEYKMNNDDEYDDMDAALEDLIAKGLVRRAFTESGEEGYELTELGRIEADLLGFNKVLH